MRYVRVYGNMPPFSFQMDTRTISRDNDIRPEVVAWCEEQFGPSTPLFGRAATIMRWSHALYGYWITVIRPEDALAFRIRWC